MRFFFAATLAVLGFVCPGSAQTASLVSSVPTEYFVGQQFCFNMTWTNSGAPGYGPYIRLILPPDISFDSASFLGTTVSVTDVGVFPASPGNQLLDPVTNTLVTGLDGGRLLLLTYPVGSVVQDQPALVINACVTISTTAAIGVPLPISTAAVYRYGDTPTGDNGPIVAAPVIENVIPTLFRVMKENDAPEGERPPGPSWPFTYTITVDIANGQTLQAIQINDVLPATLQFVGPVTAPGGAVISSTPSLVTPGGTLTVDIASALGTGADNDVVISFPVHIVDILDETNCGTQDILNTVAVDADFMAASQPQQTDDTTVTAKHIALQKGAAPTAVIAGDTVTFTLNFQVTDFGDGSAFTIVDTLPDGTTFDSHTSLTVNGGPVAIAPVVVANGDGTTTLTYDVTAAAGTLNGGSSGTIIYTATVDQDYTPAPDPLLAGDILESPVTSSYDLSQGAAACVEGSGATIQVIPLMVTKTIVNPLAEYVPGDVVTFQLTLEVPSGDTEDILFEDFLPLPVFDASDINLVYGTDVRVAPSDTLGLTPDSITIDAPSNSLIINWPNISSVTTQTLSVLVDVTVQDDPFADGLFLTNLLRVTTQDSDNNAVSELEPVQLLVRAPVLELTKGVVSSDNATANATISPSPLILPVNGNIGQSDGGDTITFRITVQNTGGALAADVIISDPGLSGLINCTLISVLDASDNPVNHGGDLFGAGLTLTDPLLAGEEVRVTYTCQLADTVVPRLSLVNTASVSWASLSGAVTFPTVEDTAAITMASPTVDKTINAVAPEAIPGSITSGDVVTYRLRVDLPEGTTTGLVVTDTLPAGLNYVTATIDDSSFGGTVDTSPTITPLGSVVTLDFGDTLTTGDNNTGNNFFDILLDARVDGSSMSNAAPVSPQAKNNNMSLNWTGNGGSAVTDAVSINFVEPILAITKTMSPDTNLDAGTQVTITLQVSNTGTGPAYDIVASDTLNDDGAIFDLTTVAEGTTPAGYSFNYSNPTVTISQNATVSLAAGASVTFSFTVNVAATVVTGSTYTNTADVVGDSQDGVVTDERASSDDGSDSVTTGATTAAKTIIATSEPFTTEVGTVVLAIGEVVTYQLVFNLTEGVTQADGGTAIIRDTLPSGLSYLSGTATIRGVYDTSLTGANLPGGLTPIPTVATAITPGVVGSVMSFDLGDISNGDNDANVEQVIIVYDALVENTTANNRNDLKTNTTSFTYLNRDGNPQSVTSNVSARIGEPTLAATKDASPATVSGGETVTFTVVLTNQNLTRTTNAWEVTIQDVLPARFGTPSVTSATLSRGATDITACAGFAGNTLDLDMSCLVASERYLGPGETITLIYTAVVDPSINFEEQVTNTATARTTSLPGSNGTGAATPGTAGDSDGERTGSGVNNELGQNVNDLNTTASDTVTAEKPTLSKTGTASLQIGATTTMTLETAIPVGTTAAFVITDDLPSGLRYTGTAIVINTPALNFSASNSPSTTPGAGTDPLVFDFGTVTNSDVAPQAISITYEVEVENILANQNTTSLQNTATLSYTGASMPLPSDSATITVIEANLSMTKMITAGAAGSDAGDTVSYQTQVSNTSASATAYAVDLRDVLPAGLMGAPDGSGTTPFFLNIALTNPGDVVVRNSDGVTALVSGDASFLLTNVADDTLTFPLFDLPPSTTLTVTYDVVLANDVLAGQMLTNNVSASYNSLADGTGRDNSDNGDDDNNADLDNYGESASATLTVDNALAIQKSLGSGQSNTVTIGDEILYDLRIDVIEGIKAAVVVTDVLPAHISFIELISIEADPNISYDGPGLAVEAPAGTITVDLGDITNPSDGDNGNDFLILHLRAQLDDDPLNVAGLVLTNSASVASSAGNAGPATVAITVVEPQLEVLKVPDNTMPSLGDEVTFNITVRHQGSTADAFDVVLNDLIPAGLTYVLGSTSGAASPDEGNPAQPSFDLGTITLAEMQKQFSFRATVNLDAPVGQPITNTLQVDYDGQSGTPTVERAYTDSGDGIVTPATPAFVDALKTVTISTDGGVVGEANPGDTLTYTIVLSNDGPDVANLVFTDTVPSNTTYVAASLASSAGTIDDSLAPLLSVTAASLVNGDSITISFDVTIDPGTPDGTIISNQGSVDSDQTVPEPTDVDGVDANGDQPTTIPVGTPPAVNEALYVEKLVSWIDDADASLDVTPNDQLRYTLIFHNRGNQTLTGVTLSDVIPSGLTYVAATASANTTVIGASVSVAIASIAVGAQAVASFDVTIDDPLFDSDATPTLETFVNQGIVASDQTESSQTDGNGDPSDGNQPTTIDAVDGVSGTPAVAVEKRWVLAVDVNGDGLVNPGDTLQYNLTLVNSGSASVINARFSDTTPTNTTYIMGSASTSVGAIIDEDPLEINIGTLAPGGLVFISFRVSVNGGTADGTILENQAHLVGDNLADTPSDDNGNPDDGLNPTLTPVVDGGGAGSPSGLTKSITASSEADTSLPDVTIGEVLDYHVLFAVPAGQTREVTLTDTLPTGLAYVPGTATLTRVFETGLNSSANPGAINGSATGVAVALVDGSEFVVSGGNLSLFLGDLINSDNDLNSESYALDYQVVVSNIGANSAGDDLSNSAGLSYLNGLGQLQNLTPSTTTVNVVEPNLDVAKVVAPPAALTIGGTISFTVTLTNPDSGDTGTAYDVQVLDLLPAPLTTLSVDSITPSGGVSGITDNSNASQLDLTIASFPANGQVIVVYSAVLPGPATPGTITNTATATWTSTPGAQGSANATPGAAGDADGERTGSTVGPNDYSSNDTADLSVGVLNLTKTLLTPQSRYAIGDLASYQIQIAVPANAVIDSAQFRDILDEGLTYTALSLGLNYEAGLSSSNNPADFTRSDDTPNPGEEALDLDFGTLTNADNAVRTLTLTYTALVDNILGNQQNQTLDNNVTLSFEDPGGSGTLTRTDTTSITVGEPLLTLVKTIESPVLGLQAGDTLDYQIVVGNSGTTSAYEVVLSDVLPSGLGNISGLTVSASSGGAEVPSFTNNGTDFSTTAFDLPPGASVTIDFTITLLIGVTPGQPLQNQVDATYTSRDGVDPNERDGSDPGSVQSNNADLDNYNHSALAPVFFVDDVIAIDKTFYPDLARTTYTLGDVVGYRVTVQIIEGTTEDLVVTDTLPDGLAFSSASVGVGHVGITTGYTAPPQQVGQVLTFDLGQVTNPSNGSADDFITFDILAVVLDVPANLDGTVLGNNAALSYTSNGMTETLDFDADGGTAGVQPLDLTIIEPDVTLTKTVTPASVSIGDEVTYTLLLDHTVASTADAYDLHIVDTLPVGLTYVLGSSTIAPTSVVGQVITFDIASLTLLDDSTSISFRASVDADAVIGVTLTNNADLVYDTQSGVVAEERAYSDSDSANVTPNADAYIEAVKTVALVVDGGVIGQVDPGDTLAYTIVLSNEGPDVNNLVFSDTVPLNTTYVAASLTSSSGTTDDSLAPDLRVTLPVLASGNFLTIGFQVTVDPGTPDGTVIFNQGSVDSDQTVPEPTDVDGVDENGDQPTDIAVGPSAPDAPLYVEKLVQLQSDNDVSGDVSPTDVLRYTLIFHNRGLTDLTGISLTDTLPSGLTYVAASATIQGANSIDVTGNALSVAIALLGAGETLVASYDVTIDDPLFDSDAQPNTETFINQGVADAIETSPVLTDSNGDPLDGSQPTDIDAVDGTPGLPALDHEKRWSLVVDNDGDGLVDPGDTLQYQITLRNHGAAAAENVILNDSIPANTDLVVGSVTSSQGFVISEDPVQVNLGDIDPGFQVTVSFRVTIDGGTPDGTIIANQALASGDNFPDDESDDNGDPDDGDNPTLTPVDSGGGAGSPTGLDKTLLDSSETGSSGSSALIGEVLTFEITLALPAGILRDLELQDSLPVGFQYLAGSAELRRDFETGLLATQDPGGINGSASGVAVALTDGVDLIQSGQDLSVVFGNVFNSDNDLNSETYRLRYQVLVENTAANQAGSMRSNQALASYRDALDQPQQLSPVNVAVDLLEGDLHIAKSVDPNLILTSGGEVNFSFFITNPSGPGVGPAYNAQLLDSLPVQWTSLSVDSITPSGGVSGITDNSAGTTLDLTIDVFPPDGSLIVVITASASGPLALGTLLNNADLTWTSLPGDQGSAAPGNPGDSDGERTGSTVAPNDLNSGDNATVFVGTVGLAKSIVAPQAHYAIGDRVDYSVQISLPPSASLGNAALQDILDQGLTYLVGSLVIDMPAEVSATLNPADFSVTGDLPALGQETLDYGFGTLENLSKEVQVVTFSYGARVTNILENQNNQSLANNVALRFDDPGNGPPIELIDDTNLLVGEAHLSLNKQATSPTLALEAGDSVSFEVVVGNDGTLTAFEVVLADVLPAGFENASSFNVVASGGAETPTITNNGSDWSTTPFDLPVGGSVTVTFEVTLGLGVIPGQLIQNSVQGSYSSRDGDDPNERSGIDPGSDQDDDGDLDNYNSSDNAAVLIVASSVALDKSFYPDAGNTTYTVGEIFQYRLRVDVIEGTIDDLVVTDELPAGLVLLDTLVGNGNIGMSNGYSAPPDIIGQVVTFDLGQVQNPSNGDNDDDYLTLDLRVRVANVVDNQNGTLLGNNAHLTYTGPSGTVQLDYDADLDTPGIQPLEAEVVLPQLVLSKHATPKSVVEPGDLVLFDLTVAHAPSSAADAFDIVLVDTLPAGLTYVVGSASPTPIINGNQLIFHLASLTLATGQTHITYQVRVEDDVPYGVPLQNSAVATFTTIAGANPDERTGVDGMGGLNDLETEIAVAVLTPNGPALTVTKSDALGVDVGGDGLLNPGDTLTYTVVVSNVGNQDALAVVFDDAPGVNTSLVNGSVTTSQGTVTSGNGGQSVVAVNIGTLAAGASASISFQVVIADPLPAGVTQVANQAVVSGEDLPDTTSDDPDTANPDDPTVTTVVLGPALSATKVDSLAIDADLDGVPSAGDTLEYTITLSNSGSASSAATAFDDTPGANTALVVGSVSSSQGSVILGNGAGHTSVSVAVGGIAPNGSVTIVFRVTIDNPLPPGTTEVANQGVLSDGGTLVSTDDPDLPGEENPTTTPLGGDPDLVVTKSATLAVDADLSGGPSGGDTLEYSIEIVNNGNGPATSLVLDDVPDINTSLIVGSVTTSAGTITLGNGAGHTSVQVTIGTLLPGASVQISFRVLINSPVPVGVHAVFNQALASSDQEDVPSDDPDTVTPDDPTVVVLDPGPLLIALKSYQLLEDRNGDGNASPGDALRYTVRIRNVGDSAAFAVIFTDTPDSHTAIIAGSITTSQGVVLTGNDGVAPIEVAVGIIAADADATITFDVRIQDPLDPSIRIVVNQGEVSSEDTDTILTDDPNQTGPDDPTVTPIVQADLRVVKSGPVNPIIAGNSFDYHIDITNLGPDPATGVSLSDPMPAGLTVTAVQSSQGTCTFTATNVHCLLGNLAVGASASVTITVYVEIAAPYLNTVTVTANETDPDPDNNDSTATVVVGPGVDLAVLKTVDITFVPVGGQVTYTIALTNNGPSTATGVEVAEVLPPNMAVISTQATQGSFNGATTIWEVGTMLAGASETLTLVAQVLVQPSGPVTNVAVATSVEPDNDPDNNTSTATIEAFSNVPTLNTWALLTLIALMVLAGVKFQVARSK